MAPLKGFFKPRNPEKYAGDPTNIVYRSSWEFKMMMQFDHDPHVVSWSSEEKKIAYMSPLDNRVHTYHPDFWVKKTNGEISIIEVKPYKEFIKPVPPSVKKTAKNPAKTSKRFIREATTYAVNQAKWAAARKYCEHRGWNFIVLTENEIFGKNG